jgi:hypothetical protein
MAVLHELLGPDLRLHGSKLNMKAAHYGSPVEWHQDWAFYPHTNDDILAIGVMLDDMDVENGPLMVVPGSHKGPVWNHHGEDGRFAGLVDPADIPAEIASAVALTGRAGTLSFHHVRALHGSALNTSERSRNLLLYEVAASDAWPLLGVADFDDFNRRLLTGGPSIEPCAQTLGPGAVLPPPPCGSPGSDLPRTSRRRRAATSPESHAISSSSARSPAYRPRRPARVGTAIEDPRPRSAEIAHASPCRWTGSSRQPFHAMAARAQRASPVAALMGCSRSSRPG